MISNKFIFEAYSMLTYPCKIPDGLEKGGRVRQYFDMPPSPMLFQVHCNFSKRTTHCGVEQFSNYEGRVYFPQWMMKNLLLKEGDKITVSHLILPEATFVKFQPQSVDFLNISYPKAVLEKSLRQFSCLTVGDIMAIEYNDKIYEFLVMELQPQDAVKIIECDVNVEFAAPLGYKDEDQSSTVTEETVAEKAMKELEQKKFKPFGGTGCRLDGKSIKVKLLEDSESISSYKPQQIRGVPNFNYSPGNINFVQDLFINEAAMNLCKNEIAKSKESLKVFGGQGVRLIPKKSSGNK